MSDDVGVDVLRQLEANGHTAWTRVRVAVRNRWKTGEVREADDDRRGRPRDMRRPCQRGRRDCRRECAGTHDALGVNGPETRVQTEQVVEAFEQLPDQRV